MPHPPGCERCPLSVRKQHGCGCSWGVPWTLSAGGPSHKGEAIRDYGDGDEGGATEEPWSRTCPQWFFRSPFVQSVLEDLPDYDGGRLHRVPYLQNDYVTYLRIASAERKAWHEYAKMID